MIKYRGVYQFYIPSYVIVLTFFDRLGIATQRSQCYDYERNVLFNYFLFFIKSQILAAADVTVHYWQVWMGILM